MNNQQAFDKIVKRSQIKKRSNYDGANWLKCPNGDRCFIGVLIPDNLYSDKLEFKIPRAMTDRSSRLKSYWHGLKLDMLHKAQKIHDEQEPESWAHHLKLLADEYGLTYRV